MDNLLIKFLKTLDNNEKTELKDALSVEDTPVEETKPEDVEDTKNDEAKVEPQAEETSTEDTSTPENEPTADEEVKSDEATETEEDTAVETKEEAVETEEPQAEETTNEDVVEETDDGLPAIPLEDVARTSEVEDMIKSAIEPLMARINELVKTNSDLADENTELKDKFMNGDFGNVRPQNVGDGEAKANHTETLDEYNKRFFG